MKKKKIKKLTFWIVCVVFVCYTAGLGQETEPHHSTSNVITRLSEKHFRIRRTWPKSALSESWEEENDTDLPTDDGVTDSGGIINNPEAKSNQSDDKTRVKRASRKAPFECVALKKEKRLYSFQSRDINRCVKSCWIMRYEWALITKGEFCSCKHNDVMYKVVPISKCNKRCNDDFRRQNCGGKEHFSKYETGYVKEPVFDKYSDDERINAQRGCKTYIGPQNGRKTFTTFRLTPNLCVEYCLDQRYKFASLYGEVNCQCNHHIKDLFTVTGKERCTKKCRPNKKLTCGGYSEYEIYGTGYNGLGQKPDWRFKYMPWKKPPKDHEKDYYYFPPINKGHIRRGYRSTTMGTARRDMMSNKGESKGKVEKDKVGKDKENVENDMDKKGVNGKGIKDKKKDQFEDEKALAQKKLDEGILEAKKPTNRKYVIIGGVGFIIVVIILCTCCKDSLAKKKKEDEKKKKAEEKKKKKEEEKNAQAAAVD